MILYPDANIKGNHSEGESDFLYYFGKMLGQLVSSLLPRVMAAVSFQKFRSDKQAFNKEDSSNRNIVSQ